MGKFRELQPPMSLDEGLTMVFKRMLQLEEKVNNLKIEKGDTGLKGERGLQGFKGNEGPKGMTGAIGFDGPIGLKGQRGEIGIEGNKGAKGNPGKDGIMTTKYIYEPLPKEIEEKLGSLGSVASASDAEKRANKLLDDIEFMKTEIHIMYKEKYEELKKVQEPPKKKSIFKRLLRRD